MGAGESLTARRSDGEISGAFDEERLMRGLVTIIAALAASSPTFAQTMAKRQAGQGDFAKYCPGVKPGGGRVIACLGKQKDKLSPACLKVVEAHSQ